MKRILTAVLTPCVLALSTAAAPAADRTEGPPAGTFQPFRLVLEKGAKPTTSKGGQPDIDRLEYFRDGKLHTPDPVSVRALNSTLSFDGKRITGAYSIYETTKGDQYIGQRYEIDAAVAGNRIVGTYKATTNRSGMPHAEKAWEGKVGGELLDLAALRAVNTFGGKADWSCWSGPTWNMVAAPASEKLVDDLKDARLLWRSEERLPPGPGGIGHNRAGVWPLISRTGGGGATPIFWDGKVYQSYFQPAGEEYELSTPWGQNAFLAAMEKHPDYKGRNIKPGRWALEKHLLKADDVVVCIDAATGQTLWRTTFEQKGANTQDHKYGPVNNTPCAGDGKLFVPCSGGILYALDANTGQPLWERPIGPTRAGSRDFCGSPIYVDGVLVMGDHRTTLHGIDPRTGKDLWSHKVNGHWTVPSVWRHDGTAYVLMHTPSRGGRNPDPSDLHCIEVKSGRIAWSTRIGRNPSKQLFVDGDLAVLTFGLERADGPADNSDDGNAKAEKPAAGKAAAGKPKPAAGAGGTEGQPAGLAALGGAAATDVLTLRLFPDRAEKAWVTRLPLPHSLNGPVVGRGRVYVGYRDDNFLLDLATGKQLAHVNFNELAAKVEDYQGMGNEGLAFIVDDRVWIRPDGSHGKSWTTQLGKLPDAVRPIGVTWTHPRHHPQTSYHSKPQAVVPVDGRLFMRGYDGIYCYDLRAGQK